MVINHSWIQQLLVNRNYELDTQRSKNSEKMASGVKMNRASDNCSGMAIYKHLMLRTSGIEKAARNAQDGASMLQTMDSAMEQTKDNLARMKELTVQSLNGNLNSDDRDKIQEEIEQIKKGINDIANNTEFNNINVLNQNADVKIKILDDPEINYNVKLCDCSSKGIGVDKIDVTNAQDANAALKTIDQAFDKIGGYLVSVGSGENSLGHIQNTLENMSNNFTRSESNINDMEEASGKMEDARITILQQATDAIFSQAGSLSKQSLDVFNS